MKLFMDDDLLIAHFDQAAKPEKLHNFGQVFSKEPVKIMIPDIASGN